MTHGTTPSPGDGSVTTTHVGRHARVIVLRGAIRNGTVEALREHLLSAIEAGVRELFLDLSEAESVSPATHELVAAASSLLADRGGALLAWTRKDASGEPTYLMAEVRDRALGELMPRGTTDRSGP